MIDEVRDVMQFGDVKQGLGRVDWRDGSLHGHAVRGSVKKLGQLPGIFLSTADWEAMDSETVVYTVQWLAPAAEGVEGGLYWGNTTIEPGRVGEEYFMTHGHRHLKQDRGEFYATIQGEGMLVLMDGNRNSSVEEMKPGTVHYITGDVAHRVVNTGDTALRFVACWPTDAGHDYTLVAEHGFSVRIVCRDGKPTIIRSDR